MKKKYILFTIISILLINLITIILNNFSKKYIMQDGIMLALTLDGEKITEYPEGTNYYVEINCENGKGRWLVDEWKLAVESITGKVICNIDFISSPISLRSKVENKATIQTNGYRYSGTNPDNYIWFNNEMWRIIGSIPTCLSANCGTNTTNLVKIIRKESIGGLAYDLTTSNYTGVWGNNTLYTLLNNYYYGSLNGIETEYCSSYHLTAGADCDYTTIGINSNSYYGKMIKNVYWNTGASSSSVTAGTAYTNEIATRNILGYIGLMSASDYGYAADNSHYNTTMDNYYSNAITSTNWLYGQGYEYTNIKSSSDTNYTLNINYSGGLDKYYVPKGLAVRPVVYLDPSVYIVSGDGTEGNPYQIGM